MFRKYFKRFSIDNMKKTGLNGYVYDFSVDHGTVPVAGISRIYEYLMVKNGIV